MSYQESFNKDDKIVLLTKDNGEGREHFLIRVHFILRNLDNNNINDINKLVNKSYLYLNKIILNQTFDKNIEVKLDQYDCSII
jgi:hypothetical protein